METESGKDTRSSVIKTRRVALRHIVAIGLTTALAFGISQWSVEPFKGGEPGHPTASDMVCYILVSFFGSLGVISLIIYPIVASAEHLHYRLRLTIPALITVVAGLVIFVWPWEFMEGLAIWILNLSIPFCVFFYFYCGIVWLERFIPDLNLNQKKPQSLIF